MNEPGSHASVVGATNGEHPRSVVKIGGSLLDLPDLTVRLRALIEELDGPVALLVGGGPAADLVRHWAAVFDIDESAAHWLAVDSLNLTARLVCGLLNRNVANDGQTLAMATIVDDWPAACVAVQSGHIPVLNPRGLLSSADRKPKIDLPESWAATSDSIAAAIAIRWSVPRLVLCKSVDVPPDGLLGGRASPPKDSAPVDDWFGQLAPRLSEIQWCNLRSPSARCAPWSPL